MNELTPEKLAELRRMLDAATPGPWRTEYLMGAGNDLLTAIIAGRATPDDLRVIGSTLAERDGQFIAAANPSVVLALLDAAAERDALAAKLDAVREWIDRRGVNVDDRDDDYMRGYRDAQRHALHDANELRAMLDATPETGGES